MSELIDPQRLQAYRATPIDTSDPNWASHKLDNAMQNALMPLIQKAWGTNTEDITEYDSGSIEKMFEMLDLERPLTEEEVVQNNRQLVAVAEQMRRPRAKAH